MSLLLSVLADLLWERLEEDGLGNSDGIDNLHHHCGHPDLQGCCLACRVPPAFCVCCSGWPVPAESLVFKATQLHADYTHKKAALNDVRSNYTRAMDTIRQNPSQSQCSRYEETFLNWLQSFCRIVNCTTELCHRSWTPFAGNCYFFSMSTLGWEESRQACVTLGSELVVIRSEEEQQFVAEYNASRAYWVGIKDNPLELTWTWVDGTILQDDLTFWDKDYPDSYFDYELEAFKNCVFLRGGAWANAVCARANYWICKRRSETPLIGL
ncbi:CD209 antigen-like protein C isoform X2 [Mobula hypostoma]|uniref:CD209 antigen-like protein C isoform X2 n=1 Tax=Mobula hypostoma TaxID=723540 RepID=UPI002FC2DAB3